ncbi:hypothetical protein BH09PAT2_BH09PAT2_04130 [soil metagenome]
MRYLTITLCIIYLLINIFFYRTIWQQLVKPENPRILLMQGETPIYEFVAEQVRLNILAGHNPFGSTNRVLYPMGWNIAMEDIAPFNGFIFVFLRPFLGIHQSFIAIMVASVFLSNITMYWLLRILKIQRPIAFISGLLYGFTPFVAYRIAGHPTYVALYLFCLPAIFFILLYKAKTIRIQILYAIFLGLSYALMVLTNLYFVIMFVLLVAVWVAFSLMFQYKKTRQTFISLFPHFAISVFTAIIALIPWIFQLIENIRFNPRSVPQGFTDSIVLSSDVLGFFWPRQNILYTPVVEYIISHFGYKPFYESFIYPGILLIIPTFLYLRYRSRLSNYLFPLYATAITILIFTLGPVLKLGTHVTSIPLPYQIIHHLPYFQMARAPGRFVVSFVFLMCIIFAFLLQYIVAKFPQQKWLILLTIIVIFFIDDTNHIFPVVLVPIPNKIYAYLNHKPSTPLLEIPFTFRDGLKNHGYMHAVWSMQPQFQHGHPLFGIYAGRVPDPSFTYFQTHPFFGPMGQLVTIENTDKAKLVKKIDQKKLASARDFFGFDYILLKNQETYSTYAAQLISPQFKNIMSDNGYSLYQKRSRKRTVTTGYRFNTVDNTGILQEGWASPEKEGRWAVEKQSTLFLNAKPNTSKLVFKAHSIAEGQKVTIYINRKKIATQSVSTTQAVYTVYVSKDVMHDLNMIQFIPSQIVIPSQVDPTNKDARTLSIFYTAIQLE